MPILIPIAEGVGEAGEVAVEGYEAYRAAQAAKAAMALAAAAAATQAAKQGVQTQACSTCDPPDPCEQIEKDANARRNELAQRYAELREDKYNLYELFLRDPNARVPGIGSWNGHVQQFRNKQANLRSTLDKSRTNGCSPAADAGKWSSIDPPSQPAPK